jgi:hypothetical protein
MSNEASTSSSSGAPRRSARSRSRTLAQLEGRTAAAKRARELAALIEIDVGMGISVSAAQKQLVQRVAVLGALAEDLEACILAGKNIDRAEYVAIVREQRQALEALSAT